MFPGQYGVPKPWYFFVQPEYWLPKKLNCRRKNGYEPVSVELNSFNSINESESAAENDDAEGTSEIGVRIRNLSKVRRIFDVE